jgi:hypothetical protein
VCADKRDKGATKEGSGRVGIYLATGITHSYTLECNYNMGRRPNVVPAASSDGGRATPERPATGLLPKYMPTDWEDVGKSFLMSLLDLEQVSELLLSLNPDIFCRRTRGQGFQDQNSDRWSLFVSSFSNKFKEQVHTGVRNLRFGHRAAVVAETPNLQVLHGKTKAAGIQSNLFLQTAWNYV